MLALAPAQDDMVTDDPRSEPVPTQPIADNNTSADFSMSDNGNEDLVESFSTQPFEQNRINDSVNSGENQWTYENANTSNSISWTPGTYGHFGPNDFDPMDFVDLEAAQVCSNYLLDWIPVLRTEILCVAPRRGKSSLDVERPIRRDNATSSKPAKAPTRRQRKSSVRSMYRLLFLARCRVYKEY